MHTGTALFAALPAPDEATAGAGWVHLTPPGPAFTGRDGRSFRIVPADVVEAFHRRGGELPVDYDHQNDDAERRSGNGPIPAAGWITALEARADGLWGRVEWTDRAKALIAAREYRFISPVLRHPRDGNLITAINGASLVHDPNLHLTALASEQLMDDTAPASDPRDLCRRFAAMLDLSEDASAIEVLRAVIRALGIRPSGDAEMTAVNAARAAGGGDPRAGVPPDQVAAILREYGAHLSTHREAQVRAKVQAAMDAGKMPPALQAWATALCRVDEESFDQFVAKAAPVYVSLNRELLAGLPPGTEPGRAQPGPMAASIAAQLGIDPNRLL